MSECKIDHSIEDVMNKLESQRSYLPETQYKETELYLINTRPTQQILNDLFHIFKKYDLVSKDEQLIRDDKLTYLLRNNNK